jgi:mono/diheme cytochrome c family protein
MSIVIRTFIVGLAAAALSACAPSWPWPASPPRAPTASADLGLEAVERGRILAASACAGCHATGRTGSSPMAEAPPFRDIVQRRELESLEAGFAEGLVTSHPAMPDYVFRASEIDDLIAWLETLQANP